MSKIIQNAMSRRRLLRFSASLVGAAVLRPDPLRAQAAVEPYRWAHRPPAGILPASDGDIVIWNVGTAGGICPHVGHPGQVLLIAGPDAPLEGAIVATGLKFRAVFLIGVTWRKKGTTIATAPSGQPVAGGDYTRISFAAGLGARPVLVVANIDLDWHDTAPNIWGDFLVIGSKGDPLELYVQKVLCRKGSYGFTDAITGSSGPHADFMQPKYGSIGDLHYGSCDIAWGYQHIFCKTPDDVVPTSARLYLQDVVFRPNPFAPGVYGGNGAYGQTVYAHAMGDLSGKVVKDEVAAGRYWAQFAQNVTAMAHPSFTTGFSKYINASTTPNGAVKLSGDQVVFPDYRSPYHADRIFNGNWRWNVEPAVPVVSAAEVGHDLRITTANALRTLLA
jgi:hypothetical protein